MGSYETFLDNLVPNFCLNSGMQTENNFEEVLTLRGLAFSININLVMFSTVLRLYNTK